MDDRYIDFFLASQHDVIQFETLEISHPQFSKVYRLVRNNDQGLEAGLEEDGGNVVFDFVPMTINEKRTKANLDYGISITFGDLGMLLPQELERVRANSGFSTKPTLIYRTYRSDDLSSPMFGPISLEVTKIVSTKKGSTFDAEAPILNLTKTGELYDKKRFTGLQKL